jgi:hypothetical protein
MFLHIFSNCGCFYVILDVLFSLGVLSVVLLSLYPRQPSLEVKLTTHLHVQVFLKSRVVEIYFCSLIHLQDVVLN